METADWKRKIRKLKKTEARIRFSTGDVPAGAALVWDEFFGNIEKKGPRYDLEALAAMSDAEYGALIAEYFLRVYNRLYDERGIGHERQFSAEVLALLGLPYDAREREVKRRFHELIIENHPDTGGDHQALLAILERYQDAFGR